MNFTDSVKQVQGILDKDDNWRLTLEAKVKTFNLKVNGKVVVDHIFSHSFKHELDLDVNGKFLLSLLNKIPGENLDICFMEDKKYIILKKHGADNLTSLLSIVRRRDDHTNEALQEGTNIAADDDKEKLKDIWTNISILFQEGFRIIAKL